MSDTTKPLEWHTEKRTVDSLIPYEENPRTMSEKQLSDLKKSLKRFNLVEIPAVDTENKVIAGHQRLKVLQLLGRGEEEIDVRIPNRPLSKEEYEQYLLTSNAVTGDWDFDKLKSFDIDLLLDIGFDATELDTVWSQHAEPPKEDNFDEEKELKAITEPVTQPGDLIELGSHRLICGDCTDYDVLIRLSGDEEASMIYSDPVFNINLSYKTGVGGKQDYGAEVNDSRTGAEYFEFLDQSLDSALAVTKMDAHIFYWCDQIYIGFLQQLYRDYAIANKRVCLWIKDGSNPVPGVAFNKCYEPCVYGVRGKPYLSDSSKNLHEVMNPDIGNGNNLISNTNDHLDVWTEKRLSKKEYAHATSKPPALHGRAIRRCTKPGDIILDSFGGSGSTLIAAEQLKRRAFLVEMEPVFCDLIIKRFEKLTGIKAVVHHEEGTLAEEIS